MVGEDACDKAKANKMAVEIPEFNNCNISMKILPLLPDGTHPDPYKDMPVFRKQLADLQQGKIMAYKKAPWYIEPKVKKDEFVPLINANYQRKTDEVAASNFIVGKAADLMSQDSIEPYTDHKILEGRVTKKIKLMSEESTEGMKNIANDLNIDLKNYIQQEAIERQLEFNKFKKE